MILPVLQRELLIRARSGFTFVLRTAIAVIGLAVVWAMWGFQQEGPGGSAELGLKIFTSLLYVLVTISLLEGVRSSALSIVEERVEGTLGLLFLTDLDSRDILAGKVGSHALSSVFSLLAVAPLLALPLILGGVSPLLCLAAGCISLNALLLSLACGTLASVCCRTRLGAQAVGYGSIVVIGLVPLLVRLTADVWTAIFPVPLLQVVVLFNPLTACGYLTQTAASSTTGIISTFWVAQALTFLVALILFRMAGRVLGSTWLSGGDSRPRSRKLPQRNIDDLLNAFGRQFSVLSRYVPPPANPLSRSLAARLNINRWMPLLMLLTIAAVLSHGHAQLAGYSHEGAPESWAIAVLAFVASQLLFAFISVQTFSEGRHTGEMEILLTTPLDDRELVNALWYLLRRIVGWTTAAAIAAKLVVALGQALWGNPGIFLMGDGFQLNLIGGIFDVATMSLMFSSAGWLGMWFGLRSRKITTAVARTFLLATIAPLVLGTALDRLLWAQFQGAANGSRFGRLSFDHDPWPVFISGSLRNATIAVIAIAIIVYSRKALFQRFRKTIGEG